MNQPGNQQPTPQSRLSADAAQWWRQRCTPQGGWLHRQEALGRLRGWGAPTPPYGTLEEMAALYGAEAGVVIYKDPMAHGGSGKITSTIARAVQQASPRDLTSLRLGPPGLSLRVLCIGTRVWLVRHSSNAWASNEGEEGNITPIEVRLTDLPAWITRVSVALWPIWSVDLVANERGSKVAMWLTRAWPGMSDEERAADPHAECRQNDPLRQEQWAAGLPHVWAGLSAIDLNLAPGIQGTRLHQSIGGSVTSALVDAGLDLSQAPADASRLRWMRHTKGGTYLQLPGGRHSGDTAYETDELRTYAHTTGQIRTVKVSDDHGARSGETPLPGRWRATDELNAGDRIMCYVASAYPSTEQNWDAGWDIDLDGGWVRPAHMNDARFATVLPARGAWSWRHAAYSGEGQLFHAQTFASLDTAAARTLAAAMNLSRA